MTDNGNAPGRSVGSLIGDVKRWLTPRPESPTSETDTPNLSRRQIIDTISHWRLYPMFLNVARESSAQNEPLKTAERLAADMDLFERIIGREMEKRSIDAGAFARSGRYCRRFFDLYPECAEDAVYWPGAILENPTLPAADREAIEAGEDSIGRLKARLDLEAQQEAAKVSDSQPGKRRQRRRKRAGDVVRPLTPKQTEAVHLFGECKGNLAEVARRMGVDRKTAAQHYRTAMGKMGQRASTPKPRTSQLGTDRRGQTDVAAIDDARREADAADARRYKRRG